MNVCEWCFHLDAMGVGVWVVCVYGRVCVNVCGMSVGDVDVDVCVIRVYGWCCCISSVCVRVYGLCGFMVCVGVCRSIG